MRFRTPGLLRRPVQGLGFRVYPKTLCTPYTVLGLATCHAFGIELGSPHINPQELQESPSIKGPSEPLLGTV